MRRFAWFRHNAGAALPLGPAMIGLGLGILTAALLWPGIPAVTAMALVALGATSLTLARARHSAAFRPLMLVHLAAYGSLYALFVGEALHAAAMRPGTGLDIVAMSDLVFSICPVAITLDHVWCRPRAGESSKY